MNKIIKCPVVVLVLLLIGAIGFIIPNVQALEDPIKIEFLVDIKDTDGLEQVELTVFASGFMDLYGFQIDLRRELGVFDFIDAPTPFDLQGSIFEGGRVFKNELVSDVASLVVLREEGEESGFIAFHQVVLFKMTLEAHVDVSTIDSWFEFTTDWNTFLIGTANVCLKMADSNGLSLDYTVDYVEKMKVAWDKTYELRIGDSIPNYFDDIELINREANVEIILEDQLVNYNQVGTYLIRAIITDLNYLTVIELESEVVILPSTTVMYLVTYKNHDGSTLYVEEVEAGEAATYAGIPTRAGYVFTSWNQPLTNIQASITVEPQFTLLGRVKAGVDTIYQGDPWVDAGVELLVAGHTVRVVGDTSTTNLGSKQINYEIVKGEVVVHTYVRMVNVIAKPVVPVISLNPGVDTVEVGKAHQNAGATTSTGTVVVESNVNIEAAGSYTIRYRVTVGEITYTKTRVVSVVQTLFEQSIVEVRTNNSAIVPKKEDSL